MPDILDAIDPNDIAITQIGVRSFNILKKHGLHKWSDVQQAIAENERAIERLPDSGMRSSKIIMDYLRTREPLPVKRKFRQIAVAHGMALALADDGSLWRNELTGTQDWHRMTDLPDRK